MNTPDARRGRRTLLVPWVQATVLLVVAAVVLWPALGGGFIWDDVRQIEDSPTITDPNAPLRYFTLNVVESWGSSGRGGDGVDTYRPLFFVALWALYRVTGPDPVIFHLAVLIAHLAVCLLAWVAARRWIGSDPLAAAVFVVAAVHPVTAEAYLWASALSEPMSVAGLLGATLILDRWCRTSVSLPATMAAGATLLLGLLSKEAVITALPVLSLYLWRVRGVRPAALSGPWTAALLFVAARAVALDGLQATGSGAAQRLDAVRSWPVLILDGLRALVTLEPVGIRHLYWDYHQLGWGSSLLAAIAVLALCTAAWLLRRRLPLVPVALGVLVCMLAPISLITTAPGWSGFGRYLYLPWVFIALAAAEAWTRLPTSMPRLRPVLAGAAVLFFALQLVGLTHAIEVYSSQENLARASTELQPDAPDGWEWLGNHYVAVGDLANAARCYARAVAIEPSVARTRHNLAAALVHLDRPAEALEQARAAAALGGVTAEVAAIAAAAALDLGRFDVAEKWLDAGLKLAPDNPKLLELEQQREAEQPPSHN